MKAHRTVLATFLIAVITSVVVAQGGPVQKSVEDFGLKSRLMPTKYRAELKLTKAQLAAVKKLDLDSKRKLDKLAEEGKNLSHEHAEGEQCPACAHSDKVRAEYKAYYLALGKILTSAQEASLKKIVKRDEEAAKKKRG
jgi:hypothetical protein